MSQETKKGITQSEQFWFTSDTHFGHKNIIKFCNRPYDSVQEMDEALIENWNTLVKPEDTIYHLGDFAFCKTNRAVEILKQLNGHKHFICGNHDASITGPAKDCFESFHFLKKLKISDQHVVLCHYPLEAWEHSFHGSFHLHGHTHCDLKTSVKFRRMDVGSDSNGMYPISFEEIYETLKNRPKNIL